MNRLIQQNQQRWTTHTSFLFLFLFDPPILCHTHKHTIKKYKQRKFQRNFPPPMLVNRLFDWCFSKECQKTCLMTCKFWIFFFLIKCCFKQINYDVHGHKICTSKTMMMIKKQQNKWKMICIRNLNSLHSLKHFPKKRESQVWSLDIVKVWFESYT